MMIYCDLSQVVSHHRDPQIQLAENYSYLFNFGPNYLLILMFEHFIPNNSDLIG